MLTPSFDVSQDDGFICINIRVLYVKISDAELHYEGSEFRFYCKPYFLHLQLPGQLAQDGREKVCYDVDSGTVVVRIPKLTPGEHFANLEMLTTLLPCRPKNWKKIGCRPLIEGAGPVGDAGEGVWPDDGEEFDWKVEQRLPSEDDKEDLLPGMLVPYGFALQHKGVFLKLQEEIPSIIDCPDPDHMSPHERRIARLAAEETAFNPDHYLADLMDNDYITTLIAFEPPLKTELSHWKAKLTKLREETSSSQDVSKEGEPGPDIVPFTTAQKDQLKSLQNREYLLDTAAKRTLYLGLVDIIFAYAYNYRTTEGEGSVESAWTICKLSSTLCWLEQFHGSVHEVLHYCVRRALCFPLYRHWELSLAVLQDTRNIFRLGRRKLLQCVLDIREILNACEPYYVLNNLYITDYIIWLQRASIKQIRSLADELDEVKVEADAIGWDLKELEEAAMLVAREVGTDQKASLQSGEVGADQKASLQSGEEELTEEVLLAKRLEATSLKENTSPLIEELQAKETSGSGSSESGSGSTENETESDASSECTASEQSHDVDHQ